MPKLRRPELSLRDHLSAKVPAGTLDRIDRIGNGDRSQGTRAVIAAGLDALEGLPVRAPFPSQEVSAPPAAALDVDALADALIDRLPSQRVVKVGPPSAEVIAVGIVLAMRDPATRAAIVAELPASPRADVSALAGALYDLVGPMLADAVKGSARGARSSQIAAVGVVGVARVVDALRAAHEAADYAGTLPDHEARRVLARAVIDAVADLQGIPAEPAPAPAPPVVAELPAEGARIDPATLRGVGGERRRNPPERRDPAPREDAPGRRLADGLRAARDARGLTQRDAAAAARVPLATYQRAEQGKDIRETTRTALTAWIAETAPPVAETAPPVADSRIFAGLLARRLRDARHARRMSLQACADAAGVKLAIYRKAEGGAANLTAHAYSKLMAWIGEG